MNFVVENIYFYISSYRFLRTCLLKDVSINKSDTFLSYNSKRTTWMKCDGWAAFVFIHVTKERGGLQFACLRVTEKETGIPDTG